MNQIMYVFDHDGKLVGMQDVTSWPVERIVSARQAMLLIDRSAEVSDKGRAICCICRMDLGERELPAGEISHSYCPACCNLEAAKIENVYIDPEMPGMEV